MYMSSYDNLGTVYRNLGDFQQAKDSHARALDIRLKQLGPEHVDVATSYNNLGIVYRNLGDCQQERTAMHVHWTYVWNSSDLSMYMSQLLTKSFNICHV